MVNYKNWTDYQLSRRYNINKASIKKMAKQIDELVKINKAIEAEQKSRK